jgi:Uma2 family endonuclease
MALTAAAPVVATAERQTYRFSFEDYVRMHEAGIFNEDSRVELIRGEIVEMAAQGPAHIARIGAIYRACARQLGDSVVVLFQCTVRLPGGSAPDPDLVILPLTYDQDAVPAPPDILAIGEVSDSSLTYDRRDKLPLYAEAGIPEAWIFNLVERQIERYTEPRDGRYTQTTIAARGEQVTSTVLPALSFDVNAILGLDER